MDTELDVHPRSRTNVERGNSRNGDPQATASYDPAGGSPSSEANKKLLYGVEDKPPLFLTLFLGLQHFLTMLPSTVATPYILVPALCIDPDDPTMADLFSTVIFVSGIATFLQVMFGTRLPLIQGGTISYVIPALAILSLSEWKCIAEEKNGTNITSGTAMNITKEHNDISWQERMCELQGAILVASALEILVGLSGAVGIVLRFVTPLAMMPVMTLLGLALFGQAATFAGENWWIAVLTAALMVILAEYMGELKFPCCSYSRDNGFSLVKLPLFKLFPVLIAVVIIWSLCAILTVTNVLPKGDFSRTDRNLKLLQDAAWFRVPYPGQWGVPSVSLAGACGMCGAALPTMIVALGNFYACASFSRVPAPPVHAMNRGIFVEGIGVLFAGLLGTGDGTMSYGENIGLIGVNKVASRRVFLASAGFMIVFGMISKFGALCASMPHPMVGGTFFVMFSLMASIGLSNLQFVNFDCSRNLIVAGLPLFCGLAIPEWLNAHPGAINTGYKELDNVLEVLLTTSVFVGGVLGLLLDNTIPGTDEERGLTKWKEQLKALGDEDSTSWKCYDLPLSHAFTQNNVARCIPVSPTFQPANCSCRKKIEATRL